MILTGKFYKNIMNLRCIAITEICQNLDDSVFVSRTKRLLGGKSDRSIDGQKQESPRRKCG